MQPSTLFVPTGVLRGVEREARRGQRQIGPLRREVGSAPRGRAEEEEEEEEEEEVVGNTGGEGGEDGEEGEDEESEGVPSSDEDDDDTTPRVVSLIVSGPRDRRPNFKYV